MNKFKKVIRFIFIRIIMTPFLPPAALAYWIANDDVTLKESFKEMWKW